MKSFITLCILVFGASVCMAQVPAKKTNLTVADREAWQKVLRWPAEMEEQWRRSPTTNDHEGSSFTVWATAITSL